MTAPARGGLSTGSRFGTRSRALHTGPDEIRVLVIDDNVAVHRDFQRILAEVGRRCPDLDALSDDLFGDASAANGPRHRYNVETVSQGEAAAALMRRRIASGDPFDVAFVDMRMPPGWNGVETISSLWQMDAHLQCVLCTAYSDFRWDEVIEQLGTSENLHLLRKPFSPTHVRRMAEVLGVKAQRRRT